MTSEGHQDQHPSSAPAQPPSMFQYRPPADRRPPEPPAPYGYPPATEPAAQQQHQPSFDTVQPTPDRVRGSAPVSPGQPDAEPSPTPG
ncbi:MAG: hypothetical protein ACRDT2_02545, partial [Natronosporangium sp.]